jgi:putative ABC transport system substrate-binding protein
MRLRRVADLCVIALLVLLTWATGCRPEARVVTPAAWMENAPRRDGVEMVYVLTPAAAPAERFVRTLRSELRDEFDVHVFPVDRETTLSRINELITIGKPSAVVLVDNPTAGLYARWARAHEVPPVALLVMCSFAEQLQRTVPNSTGIAFEPPAVTSLSDARRILGTPIRRVGVIYRAGFESYISREQARAAHEKIELVPIAVERSPTARQVSMALRDLEDADVQALWVTNDNGLLMPRLIRNAWLPFVERTSLPVVVGAPSLVSPSAHFGTYAAVPDVEGIGLQASDLIFSLQERKWRVESSGVQPPLSVKTYVDVALARKLGMSHEAERTVDVLVDADSHD